MFPAASSVQISNGQFSFVGRDSVVHEHFHGLEPKVNLRSVLSTVPNHRRTQQDIFSKATPGTIAWFFERREYELILDPTGDVDFLWGSGIPGAGKTIFASVVINDVEARSRATPGSICVAYFYMRYSEHSRVTVRHVLEVFVKQIVERDQRFLPLVEETYSDHIREGTQPTEVQLSNLLRKFSDNTKVILYFLDALDEAPVDIQLSLIKTLTLLSGRIFITSRPLKELEGYFPNAHRFEIAARDRDLDLHVTKIFESSTRLQALCDPSLKATVISTVKSGCGGMFLHASLQMEALEKCFSVHHVMQTLERFPAKIEEVYHQTWARIIDQDPEQSAVGKAALSWVLNAKRSLSIEELCCCLATCPVSSRFEPERLIHGSTVMGFCQGLLVVDEKSRLVRLIHYTAKRVIEDLLLEAFPNPHTHMASVCLSHLTRQGFQNMPVTFASDVQAALGSDPLLAYAYESWVFHAQQSLGLESTVAGRQLGDRLVTFISGCHAFPILAHDSQTFVGPLRPLHLVAFYDLPITFAGTTWLDNPNIPTSTRRDTPLIIACRLGHVMTAQELLQLPTILVNAKNRAGQTGLAIVSENGDDRLIQLLLAHPAIEVNRTSGDQRTPLMLAAERGHEANVRLLLAHPNINVNFATFLGYTALILAAREGQEAVVRSLLSLPATNVNLRTNNGETALTRAVWAGHEGVVELLLAHPRIHINVRNNEGNSALMIASIAGKEGIVKQLAAHPDIDINSLSEAGCSAATLATHNGHLGTADILLSHPRINPVLVDYLLRQRYFASVLDQFSEMANDPPSSRSRQTRRMAVSHWSDPSTGELTEGILH